MTAWKCPLFTVLSSFIFSETIFEVHKIIEFLTLKHSCKVYYHMLQTEVQGTLQVRENFCIAHQLCLPNHKGRYDLSTAFLKRGLDTPGNVVHQLVRKLFLLFYPSAGVKRLKNLSWKTGTFRRETTLGKSYRWKRIGCNKWFNIIFWERIS